MGSDELGLRPFDADNHYYEAADAFTRHVEPAMRPRVVQWVEIEGRRHHLVGGRLSTAVANPTWDPIARPGALYHYFRGNPDGRSPLEYLREREPLPAAYVERAARLGVMRDQGLDGAWVFPTLGMLYEELLRHDVEAVVAFMRGFNRWILEDWGFAHADTIFAAPYLALGDVDAAAAEVGWAVDNGARLVVMRPAAVTTATGTRSPFDPCFDPVWERLDAAGITVVIHAGDSGYSSQGYADDRFSAAGLARGGPGGPSIRAFAIERAAQDWLMQAVFERIFLRFPNLRVASVENGSDFLAPMFRKFDQQARRTPGWFPDHPVDTFRRHVWMNPFWEDDIVEVVELMGADRVVFGSDWPHIEGLPEPLDQVAELEVFDPADRRRILRDNVVELNTPRPR